MLGTVHVFVCITEQQGLEVAVRESGRRKAEFLAMLLHELEEHSAATRNGTQILRLTPAAGSVGGRPVP